MKSCIQCEKAFEHAKLYTKYCSEKCKKRFHALKQLRLRKEDPILKAKHRKRENERKKRKRALDKEYKKKYNQERKVYYRRKNNIHTEADLKRAPGGTGCLTVHGYRKIHKKDHPNAWRNGDIFEHVFIMSDFLGRSLRKGETVHHKNGIRHDNRIENLELWSRSQPSGQRVEDKIEWCKEFLRQYGYIVIKKEIEN